MYSARDQRRKRRWPYAAAVIILLGVYVVWALGRSLPMLSPATSQLQARAPAGKLAWPATGQSAVGIVGSSILETHGKQQPVPTASTAKMITALSVLQKKPLKPGDQGPTITLSSADAAIYNAYMARDGSLVKVQAGEKISQYQMLQAILLPSANNIADSLAIWAFGSLKNYQQAANQYLEDNGLVETHVGSDASGFNPSTTSTAEDLARIGELVMQDPVLSKIVGQSSAGNFPIVNNIKNVNFLLGTHNIIGVKTGNTDQAGGVYVSASRVSVNGKPVTIVTALAGSPTLFQALKDSIPLIESAQMNFKPVTVVKNGSVVASYLQPWGGSIYAVSTKSLSLDTWGGSTVRAKARLQNISTDNHSGQVVGSVSIPRSVYNSQISAPVKLQDTPLQPSTWWRLTHPF
jgi:D-alanyl-D-alanine carboxypeptidase (penicillin-binding protein 5/6)